MSGSGPSPGIDGSVEIAGFGMMLDALWCGSGDVPGGPVVAESEVEEPPEVDGRDPETEAK